MKKSEAQRLLDTIYNSEASQEEKEQAYLRLSELISLLLPE
jgi:hypothetical protein